MHPSTLGLSKAFSVASSKRTVRVVMASSILRIVIPTPSRVNEASWTGWLLRAANPCSRIPRRARRVYARQRTRSAICWRNSGAYGGLVRGIVDSCVAKQHVSSRLGQLHEQHQFEGLIGARPWGRSSDVARALA